MAIPEHIVTGEWTDEGYEFPPVCPLDICGSGGPDSLTEHDGEWTCDECGKVIIHWVREAP